MEPAGRHGNASAGKPPRLSCRCRTDPSCAVQTGARQWRKSAAPTPDRQVKTATPMRALSPEARIDPNLRRRLQKNRQPIEARLDLHGMTAAQAQKRLTQFIMEESAAGHKFVLLVTGKGAGGNGVLRRLVPEWLNMSPLAPYIVAFGAAAVVHGGSGALYVHLRSKRAGSDGRA